MSYGDGRLELRGQIFYAVLYRRGRRIVESLRTADEAVAERRLTALRRQRDRGLYQEPGARRVTVAELLDDLEADLETRGAEGLQEAVSTMRAVRDEFGHVAATELDSVLVQRTSREWLRAGKARATVNRRLELLRQAFRLASRSTPPRVLGVPHIPSLKVTNARQGFLSPADVARLLAAVADADLRDFLEWFAWTGMRPKEIRQLTWTMVDLQARTLNLDPKAAKIRRGRVLALEGPLWSVIERRLARRRLGCALVFHRVSRGKAGSPIDDYRKAFAAALRTAKLPKATRPYDLRRSALRNMVRAGVDITVAMKVSGHLTRSTFDRYNIVDEADVRDAVVKTVEWSKRTGHRTGHSSGSASHN